MYAKSCYPEVQLTAKKRHLSEKTLKASKTIRVYDQNFKTTLRVPSLPGFVLGRSWPCGQDPGVKSNPMVTNEAGKDECDFTHWSAHAFYFGDASGIFPEFIARHDLQNAVDDIFNGKQIL